MPLEIPQSLTEEETKNEFSFHNFQEIIAALIIGISAVIILIKLPFGLGPNLMIGAIFFVGSFELYRYVAANYYKWALFRKSFHNTSFFHPRMDSFFNIRDINSNVSIFKDNTMESVIRVKPIDGSLLGPEELNSVIEAYGATLKSIPHMIHVFSHSVEPSLNDFFDSTDEKIISRGGDYDEDLSKNKGEQKWLLGKMKETDARDRLNYLAILYKKKTVSMSLSDSLHYLLNIKGVHQVGKPEPSEKEMKSIREVNVAINNVAKSLEKTGVTAEILNDDELMNLYPHYFLNVKGVGKSNLSPYMWLEE